MTATSAVLFVGTTGQVSGAEKVPAARAILAAGLCTTIITDAELAAVLLAG